MKQILLTAALICSAFQLHADTGMIVFSVNARNSMGHPVRVIEKIRETGSARTRLLSPDFVAENWWPGYRGVGPAIFDAPSVSALGKKIIFTNTYNIFMMDFDGSNITTLTRFIREKYSPCWSPDGRKIAFVSDFNNNCEIYIMNHDGSNRHNISWNKARHMSPSWSPDGRYIAFISDSGGKFELYVSDTDGLERKKIFSAHGDIREPAWGSCGRIAFSCRNEKNEYLLMSVLPDGSDPVVHHRSAKWLGHPSWNFDCSKIAFAMINRDNSDIWTLDLKSRKLFNVTDSSGKDEYLPCYVPAQLPGKFPELEYEKIDRKRPALAPLVIKEKGEALPRPRMMFTSAQLPELKARLRSAKGKRFLAMCDKLIGSPKVAASIKAIANDPLRKRYTILAFADLYNKAPWLEALYSLSFAYAVTGERKYGDEAVKILFDASREYRMAYGTMQADRRVACAYDWLYPLMPEAKRKELNVLLINTLKYKLDYCLYHTMGIYGSAPGAGNYCIYFAASLGPMALAMSGEDGVNGDYLAAAERLAALTLNRWISPQGDCNESFSYFAHPVNELSPFLVSLVRNKRGEWIYRSNLMKFPQWMAASGINGVTETVALGDCDYLKLWIPPALMELCKNDKLALKLWDSVANKRRYPLVDELLWERESKGVKQDFSELPATAFFPASGYAVLRGNDTVMTVNAPQGSGHAHLEYGAVTLTVGDKRYLRDPGQAVPMADYHNQILVNGQGRARSSLARPMLSAPESKGIVHQVKVDFAPAFEMTSFGAPGHSDIPCGRPGIKSGKRTVAMVYDRKRDKYPYFIIVDRVETEDVSLFEQLFTGDAGMKLVKNEKSLIIGDALNIIPLTAIDGVSETEKRFTTRFFGQKKVTLPQGRLFVRSKKVEFVTLLSIGKAPQICGRTLKWDGFTDEVIIENGNINIVRQQEHKK